MSAFSKIKKNKLGLTLLEAIISIGIILIIIVAIGRAFPLALKINTHANQETVATNLAQAKIEEIFSLPYSEIPTGIIETKHRLSTDPANLFYYYWRETQVEFVNIDLTPSVNDTDLKLIKTDVYWQSSLLNKEKKLSLNLLIAKNN